MRFLKFVSSGVSGELPEFFDDRTYKVSYNGEVVGFGSKHSKTGCLEIVVPINTSFGMDYEYEYNSKLYITQIDNNTVNIIILGETDEKPKEYTRIFDAGWTEF